MVSTALQMIHFVYLWVWILSVASASKGPLQALNEASVSIYQNILKALKDDIIRYALNTSNENLKLDDFKIKSIPPSQVSKYYLQRLFNELAQSYMLLNKADVAKFLELGKICGNLFEAKSPMCKGVKTMLLKLIESRINFISYFTLTCSKFIEVPIGWLEHVLHVKEQLRESASDSLGFILSLLGPKAKSAEIETQIQESTTLLTPKQAINFDTTLNPPVSANLIPSTSLPTMAALSQPIMPMVNQSPLIAGQNPMIPVVGQPLVQAVNYASSPSAGNPSAPTQSATIINHHHTPSSKIVIDARNLANCHQDPFDSGVIEAVSDFMKRI